MLSEGIVTFYYRFLAEFDNVQNGASSFFGGSFLLYWSVLAITLAVLFLVLVLKLYSFNIALINASESVHENMIESIVRSPCSFFDKNPSGLLINKFSTDLGVVDNNLVFGMWDSLEGVFIIFVGLVNLCQINLYFTIPSVLMTIISVYLTIYSRSPIMECKHIDLQNKTPIFNIYN